MQQKGKLESRKKVPDEKYRIIVSPMLSVVGKTFVKEAARLGLSVASPRFISMKDKLSLYRLFCDNSNNAKQTFFISIGLNEDEQELDLLNKQMSVAGAILFDIANGYIPQLKKSVKRVYDKIGFFDKLMVGNVITREGVDYIINELSEYCRQLFIRIGIGNGGPCSTSDETGVNRGQITELIDCYHQWDKEDGKYLVSDGGIYKAGYACKAWAAGASYVLMGSYFSKAKEAETHISGDGTYFGCASDKQNELAGLTEKHSEGKVIEVDKTELKSLEKIVHQLWGGIRSSVSLCGFTSVNEMIGNGVFERKYNSLPPRKR